ncbi:AsmA family protein [Bradyrhizobium sp.]|uniref:AsmA family protein n=1 Tax=Bradyrhizobium sp. TaxID=376 RepID=UPI001EB92690|nr:AsmA family protein [Bradyrhizobium sp.]MBV9984338.1 AsmA family protein [Bradyrhizobium sp.]
MKALKLAGAALGVVIVILALALTVGIPSSSLTSTIQDRVERDTGYRLTIVGTTKISLWPRLNITLTDVAVKDGRDRDDAVRLTIGGIAADMTLASVWSGHPEISTLVVTRPELRVPLLRDRLPATAARAAPPPDNFASAITIKRVIISDGAVVMSNPHDRIENRIDDINADALIGADRAIDLGGRARAGDTPLKFTLKATAPEGGIAHQNIAVELTLDVPGTLQTPLAAKAELRQSGSVVMINGISGTLDGGAFNGWASVDVASKPLVKLDLDFQRLGVAPPSAATEQAGQPWSNAPFNLTGLNYVDAQVRISAAEINLAGARFDTAQTEATLAGGILKVSVAKLGAYGGEANGEMIVDATTPNPTYAMHCDLAGVRALPLLQNLAGFDKLDGKLQAKIGGRSSGASQHAVMANLNGTAFVNFQDGAIRGLNVARMIRSLTTSPLSGWQETKEQTDLTQLSASFRIDRGQATTSDLNLVGPLVRVTGGGMVDIGNKQLALRVEPKLVMTTEGQGRSSEPIGLGLPVTIDGPWNSPRIYPDMAGILDNPDAAYARLKEMGKGLFGQNGGNLDGLINSLGGLAGGQSGGGTGNSGATSPPGGSLGEAIGNLIQQGLQGTGGGHSRNIPNSTPPQANAPPAQTDPPPTGQDNRQDHHDSQPMNDVLKQLFGR